MIKVRSYIAQYPVLRTAQNASHFTSTVKLPPGYMLMYVRVAMEGEGLPPAIPFIRWCYDQQLHFRPFFLPFVCNCLMYLVVFANTFQMQANFQTQIHALCDFQFKYKKTLYSYTNMYLNPTLLAVDIGGCLYAHQLQLWLDASREVEMVFDWTGLSEK